MNLFFSFSACMCVYTPCTPGGKGVWHRLATAKASRTRVNGNNNNNNRYQNNILQHVAGLHTKINSYLSIVRYYVFKFLL